MKFLMLSVFTVLSLFLDAGEDFGGKTALIANVKITPDNHREVTTDHRGNVCKISTKNTPVRHPHVAMYDLGRIADEVRSLPWKSALSFSADTPCKIEFTVFTGMKQNKDIWGAIEVFVNDEKLVPADLKIINVDSAGNSSSQKSKRSKAGVTNTQPPAGKDGETVIGYTRRTTWERKLKSGEKLEIKFKARAL